MKLNITVDVQAYRARKLSVTIACYDMVVDLCLEAFNMGNGVRIDDLHATDMLGQPLAVSINDRTLQIAAPNYHLRYIVITDYEQCVGFDLDRVVTYPFIDEAEIFFGTGIIAQPIDISRHADNVAISFAVVNVPNGWGIYTNLIEPSIDAGQLDGFFVYSAPNLQPTRFQVQGQQMAIDFHYLVQNGHEVPLAASEVIEFVERYLSWLEANLAPYRQLSDIRILFLQAPPDFAARTNQRAGVTGENVQHGIVAYGPADDTYWQERFGYSGYRFFLLDGLAHEIMHFYTTTAWQGRYKSVLVAGENCPPADARLIGEALNLYFSRQFVYDYVGEPRRFYTEAIAYYLNLPPTRKNPFLDLLLLDMALQEQGQSLLTVFQAMLARPPIIYESARILTDKLPESLRASILDSAIPDYRHEVGQVLSKLGYQVITTPTGRVGVL
ncbi:MAG: hypothetical protein H6673_11485 [Anaerolineales bacterium]|nr:hypothetical protein [Anaerolineales bacterium]